MSLASAKDYLVYHGSPSKAERPAFGSKENMVVVVCPGRPFFVTPSRSFAKHFARGGSLSSFRLNPSRLLDATAPQNADKLLEVFNADSDSPDAPWDDNLWGDVEESVYLLLESRSVWDFLTANGFDAVRLIEQHHPRIESFAILNPAVLQHLKTVELSVVESDPSPGK